MRLRALVLIAMIVSVIPASAEPFTDTNMLVFAFAPNPEQWASLEVTAWHNNMANKKTNPDPNQWVGWGDRTVDETAHAWINIVYMNDEDFRLCISASRRGVA
jgi:hypothetical protein